MTKYKFIRPIFFIFVVLLLSYSGCATTQDISLMENRFSSYRERLDKLEDSAKRFEENDAELKETYKLLNVDIAELTTKLQYENDAISKLQAALEDYSQLVEKNKKGNDIEIDGLMLRLDRLEEIGKNLQSSIRELKESNKTPTTSSSSIQNKAVSTNSWEDLDEEGFYNLAYQTFQKGEYETAREIFTSFLDKFPKGRLSDNATFWIGESYYKTNNFEQAILEYEKVKQNYPNEDKVPAAILKQALSFLKLNVKEEAKILLKNLIQNYPDSEQAKLAKAELEKIE